MIRLGTTVRRGVARRGLAALLAAVAACGCAPRHAATAPGALTGAGGSAAPAFLRPGFEVASVGEGTAWRLGDRVVLEIAIDRPAGRVVRYLETELIPGTADPAMVGFKYRGRDGEAKHINFFLRRTRLRVYDEEGRLASEAEGALPIDLLSVGLGDAIALSAARPDRSAPLDDAAYERSALGWGSLVFFSASTGKNRAIRSLAHQAVRRPSLLSLAFNRTAEIAEGRAPPEPAEPWTPAPGVALPTHRHELQLSIADQPALRGTVRTTPVRAPLGLCGGILEVDAFRPDDARVRTRVRLVSANRGVPPSPHASERRATSAAKPGAR